MLLSQSLYGIITLTFSANSETATTITLSASGSATTNANGTAWSNVTGHGSNALDDNQGSATTPFNFITSNLSSAGDFALTGDLTFSGGPAINFTNIYFDHDNNGDDVGLSPAATTSVSASTLYTASGSATFTLAGGDNFSDFITGSYPATNFDSVTGGWLNFNLADIQVVVTEVAAVPEPSTFALFAGLAMVGILALRRRK